MLKKGGLIENISSKYILNTIFDYISNENYKLKLFAHSKSLQEKYDFKIEYKYAILKESSKRLYFIEFNKSKIRYKLFSYKIK